MASALSFIVLLCVTSGLLIGADAASRCPCGWTEHGTHCFIFQSKKLSWSEADLSCRSLGGNLVSIHSSCEHDFIRGLIKKASGSDVRAWIGLNDILQEGRWVWTDGLTVGFTDWSTGQPDNYGGNEDCIEINYGGPHWNDHVCDIKKPFVCAKTI